MIKSILLFALTFCMLPALCQEKEKEAILAEAWLLYNSERASWHGTDIFLEKFPVKKEKMGGYFSYSEGNVHTCIFYDREAVPNVLASVKFNDSFVVEAAEIDSITRKLNTFEADLYTIRQKAFELSKTDTLFKRYEKTSLNLIPLIANNKKKVYMLTGPSASGVVIFGNDYLVEFDKKNNVRSKKALHKNLIPIKYTNSTDEKATIHNHLDESGYLMTATDICTLLLYSPYTQWQQHYVVSKKYVSIWDCDKENLTVLTKKAWDKIMAFPENKDKTNDK